MVDFNVIIGDINRIDGNTQEYEVCDFIDFMFDTGLHKLQSVRWEYTLTNNHTYSRIDKALVNIDWMSLMSAMRVHILESVFSNHSPLSISFNVEGTLGGRPFRFDYI